MYDPLTAGYIDEKTVTLVGSDFVLDKNSDIKRLLKNKGYTLREIPACKNWEEYQCLGAGEFFISCYPPAKYGAEMLAERLNRKHLYLPGSFDYREIKEELRKLLQELQTGQEQENISDIKQYLKNWKLFANEKLHSAKMLLVTPKQSLVILRSSWTICIIPDHLDLQVFFLKHGFHVTTVYLDSVSPEEKMYLTG